MRLQNAGCLVSSIPEFARALRLEHVSTPPKVPLQDDIALAMETHVRGDQEPDSNTALPHDELNSHAMRTKQLFKLSRTAWLDKKNEDPVAVERYENLLAKEPVRDHCKVRAAAIQSRKVGEDKNGQHTGLGASSARVQPKSQAPLVQAREPVTAQRLRDWLYSERVLNGTNAKQHEFLELIVDRILVELDLIEPNASIRKSSEPMVWLLHGSPGTGKSHELPFLRELFGDLLGYTQGIEFQVVAFQAVNAADIKGETIHQAFGLNRNGKPSENATTATQRMGYWRWLIVDEISMVSAKLLARMEQQQRECTSSKTAFKLDAAGKARPFAGVNVVFLGDFYQLPPPEGGFIADVPSSLASARGSGGAADPAVERGRELFWQGAVQGVTELTEMQRCTDEWYNEVVEELRRVALSEANWAYLHGFRVEGCKLSAKERASRKRVIDSPMDPRLQEAKFREAPVIVANNDARYQINKDKARAYSQATGAPLKWSVASDKASTEALQAQDCSKEAKRKWLQYHDRRTGDLCGLLPLAIGMPVALTDHVDRSPDKLLLRGTRGHVHSWVWQENNNMPDVVYVKFADAQWQLAGTPEPGIYPLRPVTEDWYLDHGRDNPVLKVKRTQIQLTPAFAITAYNSQGKTLPAALLDLHVDKNMHPTLGTVAASRVRSRHDVLILRPFPRWLFNRGAPEGPDLLLRTLRQDPVDWIGYREARNPFATCKTCGGVKDLDGFSDRQWQNVRACRPAECLACANGEKGPTKRKLYKDMSKHVCASCGCNKIEAAFPLAQVRQERKRCLKCAKDQQTLTCSQCRATKPANTGFEPSMLTLPEVAVACKECQKAVKCKGKRLRAGWFRCMNQSCRQDFPLAASGNNWNHYCLNCASQYGAPKVKGQFTCKKCRKTFQEEVRPGAWRPQRCPECRRPATTPARP